MIDYCLLGADIQGNYQARKFTAVSFLFALNAVLKKYCKIWCSEVKIIFHHLLRARSLLFKLLERKKNVH